MGCFVLGILFVSFCLNTCVLSAESNHHDDNLNWRPYAPKPADSSKLSASLKDEVDPETKSFSEATIAILVIIPMIGVNVFLLFFKYAVRRNRRRSADMILHHLLQHSSTITRNGREYTIIRRSSIAKKENELQFIHLSADTPNSGKYTITETNIDIPMNRATLTESDEPPDYATVVTSDLSEQVSRFPTVTVEEDNEPPPPNFEERMLTKY